MVGRRFELGGVQYRIIGKGKKETLETLCTICGGKEFEHVYTEDRILELDRLGTMEATIMKCKSCGTLFFFREVNDYDYIYYSPVEVVR
ncbi:hypothetical protein DRH14_02465 [Candidatus Shapirobacteria bacterium]|nr:MAG: hypothetical protein DRH14_02465 [Candidatus Shapirobacteria bacterium]